MSQVLSTRQAAAAVGRSYDWFRKHWRELVRETGFPHPLIPGSWDAGAVAAWRARRSAGLSRDAAPAPANDVAARRAAAIAQIEKARRRG